MKSIFLRYSGYNHWANQLLLQCIFDLKKEKADASIVSSFSGILPTIVHLWNAESIWWQRIKLEEHVKVPGNNFSGSIREAGNNLLAYSLQWVEWVGASPEVGFDHVFEYRDSKKELYKQPVYEALLQLFNHQSYHRGQLVTMLRQLGVTNIPATDFIVYCRKNKLVVVNNRVLNAV